MPAACILAGVTGFQATNLPLAGLLPGGQPGCTLFAAPDLISFVATNATGTLDLAIPSNSSLIGAAFTQQGVAFELGLAGLGATTATNALTLTIGWF